MTVSGIWDLRRGDAGDNRTSPYGRGFWGIIASAALDFSILKASVAFLLLILGPALILGMAVPAAFLLARLKLHLASFAGSGLLPAILVVALLAAGAFWIGRPLLARAVNSFWHLHYALVFPAFVMLRETLRIAAERFPGSPLTPQELYRRRRAGSVLAAFLFAAAGALLAWAVGASAGFQLMAGGQFRPWAAVMSGLGNAALILGLATVIESIYWLRTELMFSSPVLGWNPGLEQEGWATARVAHLSDLHVVGERYGYRMESGTLGPQGNECILEALRKLSDTSASVAIERILVTGDVTDAGTRAEWAEFLDLLREYPALCSRMSFVPGNHDVNIVDRAHPALLDLPWSTGQALRKLRVILALDEVQGGRAHLVDHASGAPGPSLHEYLREGSRAELLRGLAQCGSPAGRREIAKIWEPIFPLVEPSGNSGYGLILLNSNARSHFSLTNAIGVVDRQQLAALRSILRRDSAQAWMILLHHHLVEYPLTCIGLRDRVGLALINACDVLAAIAPHAARVLVLHGHRHRDWIGACGGVVLCSAPSATLGSYGGEMYQGSFRVHAIATSPGGGIRLTATERVKVA